MKKKKLKKSVSITIILLLMVLVVITGIEVRRQTVIKLAKTENRYFYSLPKYEDRDFGYKSVLSQTDNNKNGVDDYYDIVVEARRYALMHPAYQYTYYGNGGFPPDQEGISTDMLWRGLKACGVDLKALINEDIMYNPTLYTLNHGSADPNIDFRNITNIETYLKHNGETLDINLSDPSSWQAGDIVIFNHDHLAICSSYRTLEGYPYLIHHYSKKQKHLEEDVLISLNKEKPITGHFRWIFN